MTRNSWTRDAARRRRLGLAGGQPGSLRTAAAAAAAGAKMTVGDRNSDSHSVARAGMPQSELRRGPPASESGRRLRLPVTRSPGSRTLTRVRGLGRRH